MVVLVGDGVEFVGVGALRLRGEWRSTLVLGVRQRTRSPKASLVLN